MNTQKNVKQHILSPLILKYAYAYVLGLFMLLVVDYVNLYIPQFTGEVMDELTNYSLTTDKLFIIARNIVICGAIITCGRFLYRYFIFGSSRKIEKEMRDKMFAKLETLSQRYYNENKTGDLMSYFTNDLDAIRQAIGPSVVSCFDSIVLTILCLYRMMTYVSVTLTIYCVIPMILIAFGGYFFGVEFKKRFTAKQKSFGNLQDIVQESVSGERVIKAFVQEDKQVEQFELVNSTNRKINLRVVRLMSLFGPLLTFVIGITYVIAIIYGGRLTMLGEITLGRFIAFNSYIGSLVWPMLALGESITSVSQGLAGIKRIHEVFDEVPDIQNAEKPDQVDHLTGNIELKNVFFQYKENLPYALDNISVSIQKGETLAILGRTGSGKTTFVNLLTRVYDIQKGSISYDGHEIKNIPLHVLRENIAYVPQDNFLFSNTLAGNISFGKLDATLEEVQEAAKMADIHDNIMDFPEKYDTMVGERGVTLSGGQKQRSSIARAILKDSPILILDDALSAVDTDTEEKILTNLKKIREGKTTIMIAHRVTTVQNADYILILDDGKAIEYGTYAELMALNGEFATMVKKQQLEKEKVAEKEQIEQQLAMQE